MTSRFERLWPGATARGYTAVALIGVVCGVGAPAQAGPQSDDESADRSDRASAAGLESADHWTFGAGVAARPEFEGSDEYAASPVPIVDVQYGRFFAKTSDGIGAYVVDTPDFTVGASVNWMEGYDGDDVARGIDDVDGELGARLFASTRFQGVEATLGATQAVTDTDRGLLIDAELAYPWAASKRFIIKPSISLSWANGTYMDGYFGISSSESATSGLRRYEPSNGFKDVSLRISARYRITDSITGIGAVGVTHLLGEAADSPMVEQETSPTAFLGLSYTF